MRRSRGSDAMNTNESDNPLLRDITRRHFFRNCAVGVGSIALASLFAESAIASPSQGAKPQAARGPHHKPRAKNVIYLFMAGGPSQLELFDYKPKLVRSEEHTSELQSPCNLVCRLLLEKKKK